MLFSENYYGCNLNNNSTIKILISLVFKSIKSLMINTEYNF